MRGPLGLPVIEEQALVENVGGRLALGPLPEAGSSGQAGVDASALEALTRRLPAQEAGLP